MSLHDYCDLLAQGLALLFCAVIIWRAEPVLNRMRDCTAYQLNLAFYLLLIGALTGAVKILSGGVPEWSSVLVLGGVALLLLCERRIRIFLRTTPKRGV